MYHGGSTEIAHGDQECMHPQQLYANLESRDTSKCCQSYRACARRQFLYEYYDYGFQCLSCYKMSDDNTRTLLRVLT